MADIKPIETRYKGYRFRSRLEARWAVFFDALGIEWEYEKEGYNLGEHGCYLPDFWLPRVGSRCIGSCWVEVKPPVVQGDDKLSALVQLTKQDGILVTGPPQAWSARSRQDGWYEYSFIPPSDKHETDASWDNYMGLVQCFDCGQLKFEYRERNYMVCPRCGGMAGDDTPRLMDAYEKSRGARFDHGESGCAPAPQEPRQENPSTGLRFAKVPLTVLYDTDLSPYSRLIYAALNWYQFRGEHPTQAQIGEDIGLCATQVRRCLSTLERKGYITGDTPKSKRGGRSKPVHYTLHAGPSAGDAR